jgi:glutamate/aspartate transport system permease protein
MGVLNYSFDWSVLWRQPYGGLLIDGILTTLHLSLLAWIVAIVLGIAIGVFRVSPSRLVRFVGGAYVQVFRNIPFLVQLFFWYFAAPLLLPHQVREWLYDNVPNFSYLAGVIALGTYTASRIAEQLRSGLLSIPRDQYHAAYSTGLTTFKTYRYVIVPYALRIIMPPLTTEFLTCFKNSALTMTIGVMETTHTAYYINSFTFHGLETTTAACLVYMCITLGVMLFMSRLEKRTRIPGMIFRRQ